MLGRAVAEGCKVTDNCDVVNGFYRDTEFNECLIEESKIRRSTITDCKVTFYVKIHTSTIKGGVFTDAYFSNCQIKSSRVRRSTLHETGFDDLYGQKFTFTFSPLAFRKFPPAVRSLIFTHVLAGAADERGWAGEAPALIVALRTEPELYREAMDVMYKYQPLNVSYLPKYIPESLYRNVQKLTLL
jgi:hypothetical protein